MKEETEEHGQTPANTDQGGTGAELEQKDAKGKKEEGAEKGKEETGAPAKPSESDKIKDQIFKNVEAREKEDGKGVEQKAAPVPGTESAGTGQAKGAKKEGEEEATEADKKDIPVELPEPAKQAIIRERIKLRKERETFENEKKAARTEAGRAERESTDRHGQTRTPGDSAQQAPPMDAKGLAQALQMRASAQRVLEGYPVEGLDETKAKRIMELSDVVMAGVDDEKMLADVIDLAHSGTLGKDGMPIINMVREMIPLVQIRVRAKAGEEEKKQAFIKGMAATIRTNITAQEERFPALKDPKSEEVAFAEKWMKENVGTVEKPGVYMGPDYSKPELMGWLYDTMMNAFKAEKYAKVVAERDILKKRFGANAQPLGDASEQGGETGGRPQKESEKILQQLIEANPGMITTN